MKTICWLYGRFSTTAQGKDDKASKPRQEGKAKDYAKSNDCDLSRIFFDEGVSGGYGRNHRKQLDALLTELERGNKPNQVLIENVDRLSRQQPKEALDLVESILNHGVEIVELDSGQHINKDNWQSTAIFLPLVLKQALANEERQKRKERSEKNWLIKIEALKEGKQFSKQTIGWVEKDNPKKVIPERAAIIKRIFKLYTGGMGIATIAKTLNGKEIQCWGNKKGIWHWSYLSNILHNRAVLGEFQPHKNIFTDNPKTGKRHRTRETIGDPIKGYYPAIIDEATFYRTQEKLDTFKGRTKTDKVNHLFSGVSYCQHCQTKSYLINTGKDKIQYYSCWGKIKHSTNCQHKSIPYAWIEESFVAFFQILLEESIPLSTEDSKQEVEDSKAKVIYCEKQIAKYEALIEDAENAALAKRFIASLTKWQGELENAKDALQKAKGKASSGDADPKRYEAILQKVKAFKTDVEVRRSLQDFIASYVDRIDVNRKNVTYDITLKPSKAVIRINKTAKGWDSKPIKGFRSLLK